MANVNTGKRTKAQETEALNAYEASLIASGDTKIVVEGDERYAVQTINGMSVRTRIA